MTKRRLGVVLASGAGLAALLSALPAAAQTPAPATDSSLKEVVVTAQRRAENLQKVPISVTAFSGEALAAEQITSTLDIAREVPNMFAANNVGQGSANTYYIRGLGQTQSFPTFEPQVGTYIDDIYISRQNANNFALFGVDSLQVLNGPQGTLFGRNSTGGAIIVSLTKPGKTFGGDVSVGVGSYGGFSGQAAVNLPISDQVLTRTSIFGVTDDGYVKDVVTHQKLNAAHNWGIHEGVTLLPNALSNVEWSLSGDYERNDNANLLNQPQGGDRISDSGFSTSPGALTGYFTGHKSQLGQGALVQTWGFMSNIKAKFDSGTVNFITGFRGLQQDLAADFPGPMPGAGVAYDALPTGLFVIDQSFRGAQFSQELKWSSQIGDKFTYTAGGFYLFESNRNSFGEELNLSAFIGLPASIPFPLTVVDEFLKNQTLSEAVYAQGDYKITDKLTLTVGARYTHEIKTILATPNKAGEGFTTAQVIAAGFKTHLDSDEVTPRVALQYQVDPGLMVFASATRGFQGGGWNSLVSSASDLNNFNPETMWTYETGFRFETSDHKLRLNNTLFYENVDKYQLLYDNPLTGSFDTANAANLAGYGMETSITWKPINRLTLGLNIGLMDAFYFGQAALVANQQKQCVTTGKNCDNGIVRPNGSLANPSFTPPVTAALSARYDIDVGSWRISPRGGLDYSARETIDTAETPFFGESASHLLINLGADFSPSSLPLTFTAECKNCTMVNYRTALLLGSSYYNNPGRWTLSVRYKF